ncbi:MAG: alpha/beta hydrolase [Dehalococcoidia bacterium]|jgi:pimeloyl-ACP methyl ester carboxylesterase|nr:alpha/beta hydrolase [Dehalococcoidia bacterium]
MPTYRTPDRVQLNYKIAGDARPTIILIHGWGSRLDHWQPVASALARHHRVLRMDLRGHGRSEAPTDGYSIRQFADDVGALARSQRISNAVVVGHSMGSTVALELARRHPRIAGSLVLVDGALDQYSTARDVERTELWRILADAPYDEAMPAFYSQFFPDPRDADLATRVVRHAARTPEHAAIASWRASLTANVPALANQLRQPALYVNSSNNTRTAADVGELLPRAEFAQVAGSGHFIQLEAPDQLVAMIRRFVDRL